MLRPLHAAAFESVAQHLDSQSLRGFVNPDAKLQPRILLHDVLKLHTRTRTLVRIGALVLQMFQILCDVLVLFGDYLIGF